LWIVAVDGGQGNSGITLPQAASMMMALGAATALNLDGGGSTVLAQDDGNGGANLISVPKDSVEGCTEPYRGGCERYVGASFGIRARPLDGAAEGAPRRD
jgi:hypothetical protein